MGTEIYDGGALCRERIGVLGSLSLIEARRYLLLVNLSRKDYLCDKSLQMKIMSVGEFKTHFSQALKTVQAGEEIGISYGKNKEVVACLVPKVTEKQRKRKIGILEGKGKVSFGANFKISSEEFLGL